MRKSSGHSFGLILDNGETCIVSAALDEDDGDGRFIIDLVTQLRQVDDEIKNTIVLQTCAQWAKIRINKCNLLGLFIALFFHF